MLTSFLNEKIESHNDASSNMKFMCDKCGTQMHSVNSLKLHLIEHETKNQLNPISNNHINKKSNEINKESHQIMPINSPNTKLSSIIAATKSISSSADSSKKNSFVINIPQTMKVFNVKEILSKLKSLKDTTDLKSDNYDAQVPIVMPTTVSTQSQIEGISNINNSNIHEIKTSIIQLEDLYKLNESNHCDTALAAEALNELNDSNCNQLPYHYSECENIYICNLCNCTYDSLRSIKAHLWKHSGHHKFSYPIHDYNNRSESTGKPITLLTKPINSNLSCMQASVPIQMKIQLDNHNFDENEIKIKDEKHIALSSHEEEFYDEYGNKKKLKHFKIKQITNELLSPVSSASSSTSSMSPSSSSSSNLNRSIDSIGSGNVNIGGGSNNGGGICSVLLEVIEKLRDAESSNTNESCMETSILNENDINKLKSLKRAIKIEDNHQNSSQTTVVLLKKRKKSSNISNQCDSNQIALGKTQQVTAIKKERKKRVSKKLNQLIAMNCTNSTNYVSNDTKEVKSNKISMLIESQKNSSQSNYTPNNNNSSCKLSQNFNTNYLPLTTENIAQEIKIPISNYFSDEAPVEVATEECTIETSIVNSLYDDDTSIINNFDLSNRNSLNVKVEEKTQANSCLSQCETHKENDEEDVDFNFSYKNHNGVLLNDLNIKLIEKDSVTDINQYAFTCFKCSLFFNDLLALCEHKTNCEKNYEQFIRNNQSNINNTTYKYYLCDLCHSNDPLNTVVNGCNSNTSNNNNNNKNTNKNVISYYYLLNISDKKFYFKCFSNLESISEHFKAEHHHYLPKNLNIIDTPLPSISTQAKDTNEQIVNKEITNPLISENDHHSLPLNSITSNNCNQTDSISFNTNTQCNEIKSLLESLASNDGHEQYACCLCSYVCYHLPSLKSHMWTHVKHEKFDYSVNTSIINAALDYENKLNRNLTSINSSLKNVLKSVAFEKHDDESSHTHEENNNSSNSKVLVEKKLTSILEIINYSETKKKLSNLINNSNKPMVLFRCSKCGFETIDLFLLRLHKKDHYTQSSLSNEQKMNTEAIVSPS